MTNLNDSFWVKAKVLPGKEALSVFMKNWRESGSVPFNGEVDVPSTLDPNRLLRVDTDQISHCIIDVAEDQFDEQTLTVPIRIRMCGPHGAEAREKYIKKDIRFVSRVVEGVDRATKQPVQRVVTFDCIQRPDGKTIDKHLDNMRQNKEIATWKTEKQKQALKNS